MWGISNVNNGGGGSNHDTKWGRCFLVATNFGRLPRPARNCGLLMIRTSRVLLRYSFLFCPALWWYHVWVAEVKSSSYSSPTSISFPPRKLACLSLLLATFVLLNWTQIGRIEKPVCWHFGQPTEVIAHSMDFFLATAQQLWGSEKSIRSYMERAIYQRRYYLQSYSICRFGTQLKNPPWRFIRWPFHFSGTSSPVIPISRAETRGRFF